jgi:hypothetical protein
MLTLGLELGSELGSREAAADGYELILGPSDGASDVLGTSEGVCVIPGQKSDLYSRPPTAEQSLPK